MALPQLEIHQHQVEALTEHYMLSGTLETTGTLMSHLDRADRANILFKDVTVFPLDDNRTLDKIQVGELWVRGDEIVILRVLDQDISDSIQRLQVRENLRVFLPRFIVQAAIHRGEDTRVSDMFEVLIGRWVAAHEARIFALRATRAMFSEAPLLLINRHHIQFYEAVKAAAS